MRYFIPGIIAGVILNIFLFSPVNGIEIYPEWTGALKDISSIDKNHKGSKHSNTIVTLRHGPELYRLGGDGTLVSHVSSGDKILAASGNGEYYITYDKVGSSLEFYRITGEPFWKLDSREYPYLSRTGKLIFMMNGDHSRIRFIDFNGNPAGDRQVVGRLCTVIAFSANSDFGATGFLDGSWHVVSPEGKIVYSGRMPAGNMVKGITLSPGGKFAAVHYGSPDGDRIRITNLMDEKFREIDTETVHSVKLSMHVRDNGLMTYIDREYLVHADKRGRILFRIKIPARRPGYASLDFNNGVYSAGYTGESGYARLILFRDDGNILLSREFPSESIIRSVLRDNILILRGSDNLYCYSLHRESAE